MFVEQLGDKKYLITNTKWGWELTESVFTYA